MRSFAMTLSLVTASALVSCTSAWALRPYRVQEGDSLWIVARKHNTTVKELCRLNHLKPDRPLQIDQRLVVPSPPAGRPRTAFRVGVHQYIGEPVVNVRRGPGTKNRRIALARKGTPCRVLKVKRPWVRVRFANGTTGWVREDLLARGTGSATTSRPVTLGSHEKGYIAGTVVNIRSGPGTNHRRLTQARKGAAVRIVRYADGWMQVRFGNGVTGWVAQELVKLGQKMGYAYVKHDVLNLRAGPASTYPKVGQLTKGQKLTIYKRKGEWLRVQCCSGQFGWVAGWLVRVQALPSRSRTGKLRSTSGTGHRRLRGLLGVIATAMRYRGVRYRFGSASPRRGFDCSGFVSYVLAQHGVRLPHSARGQYSRGKRVPRTQLRPGDLVFFRNTYRRGISHVGLYVGKGRFIHASSSRGVRVSSLSHPYYRARYAGARRVL